MILAAMAAETSSAKDEFDAYSDSWGWQSLRERFGGALAEEYPGVEIAVSVEDEDSKVSLGDSDPKRVAALFESLGWPKLKARELADAMQSLARRESESLSAQSGTGEANASLAQLPEGLRFVTQVPEITSTVLYGEDVDFDGHLDNSEDDGADSYPPDNHDGVLWNGLARFLTLRGDGMVNPNLAPYEVLLTVPGVSKRIAEEIVAKRAGSDGVPGTPDDFVFKKVEDLTTLASISQYAQMEYSKMAPYMRATTSCFAIRACACTRDGNQRSRIQVCVKRGDEGKLSVLSWLEDDGF